MTGNRFWDLCDLNTKDMLFYEDAERLFEKIVSIADFFGFRCFPDELKIQIYICNKAEFKCKKEESDMNESECLVAFARDINKIFVLEYRDVNIQYSRNMYNTVIVHECIHVFQAYFSKILPRQYVWLYESVACYLAEQEKLYDRKSIVSWEVFTNDFYKIDNCYGLAYCFGTEMFKQFGDEILRVIKTPRLYMDQLEKIYNVFMRKSGNSVI